jgi:hypothetical protein
MSFCENKKIILNSRGAFLKFRIVDCGSKLSCPQDKMIKKFDFKTSLLSHFTKILILLSDSVILIETLATM